MTLEETERMYLNSLVDASQNRTVELNPLERMLFLGIHFWLKNLTRVEIFTQWQVKQYCADFFIQTYCHPFRKIIIECDGHDFHEKTKEQARKDKQRDRFFTLEGYEVLRFAGSEIYKDPFKCGEEVWNFVTDVKKN